MKTYVTILAGMFPVVAFAVQLQVIVESVKPFRSYGPLMRFENHEYGFEDGYFRDGGKPVFLIGDGCNLCAGQATPTALWLAKLQGVSMVAPEAGAYYTVGPVTNNRVAIGVGIAPGNISWQRECVRWGFLDMVGGGQGQFFRSKLRNLPREYPDFGEIHGDYGHNICFDTLAPLGRQLVGVRREAIADIDAMLGNTLFEIGREPGPRPSNARIRSGFRTWARKKYGSLEEACRVWRRSYSSWDDIEPFHIDERVPDPAPDPIQREISRRKHARADFPEMYYDWLEYARGESFAAVEGEVKQLRKTHPSLRFGMDTRATQHHFDHYTLYDPYALDGLMDYHEIHNSFCAVNYEGATWDEKTLVAETWFPFLLTSYFRSNTTKPIVDAEDVVDVVMHPGSDVAAMARYDLMRGAGEWVKKSEASEGKDTVAVWTKSFVPKDVIDLDLTDGTRTFHLVGGGVKKFGSVWINGEKVGFVNDGSSRYDFDVTTYLKAKTKNTIVWRIEGSKKSPPMLLGHCLIVPHNRINKAEPWGEKQYAAKYWTFLMHGLSAVMSWSWGKDVLRPYLAQIAAETRYAASVALPDIRNRKSPVAIVYSYAAGRGLPTSALGTAGPYMAWYNACLFDGVEPDVLGEQSVQKGLDPSIRPLVIVPHVPIVEDATLRAIRAYIENGGRLIVTEDSLKKTFSRYVDQPPLKGCVVAPSKLDFAGARDFLKPYLPAPDIVVKALSSKGEDPLIERKLAGGRTEKILYFFNWGGRDQELSFALPGELAGWKLTPIRGSFRRKEGVFSVTVVSQAPAAAVLSKDGHVDPDEFTISPIHRAEIARVLSLNKTVDPIHADVLFPKDDFCQVATGKEIYPELLSELKCRGLTHAELNPSEWTAELLANKKLIIFPESKRKSYIDTVARDRRFCGLIRDYVARGGALALFAYTAQTANSSGPTIESFGKTFGYEFCRELTVDPESCGLGDPYQVLAKGAALGALSKDVSEVQLYTLTPFVPTDPLWRSVVKVPGGLAMGMREFGEGRIFLSADNLFCQPTRIHEADNARLLGNVFDWLTGKRRAGRCAESNLFRITKTSTEQGE